MNKNSIHFFQKNDYELIIGTSTHTFPIHIHDSTCCGIITKGSVEFYNKKRKILQAGDTYWISRGTPHYFSAINEQSYSYITLVLKEVSTPQGQNPPTLLDQARQYIHHSSDFNMYGLSEYVSLSKYHLIREFKKKFGLSPYQYYKNCQIKKVRQGLLSQQTLPDLAYMLGFSHQSHMCNDFKKYMGISPVDYQKSCFSIIKPVRK